MMTAQVSDCRKYEGPMDEAPKATVKVGDWVDFKSDHEQSGRITKIESHRYGTRLHLHNPEGFGGEYLRYAKNTVVEAGDCWI